MSYSRAYKLSESVLISCSAFLRINAGIPAFKRVLAKYITNKGPELQNYHGAAGSGPGAGPAIAWESMQGPGPDPFLRPAHSPTKMRVLLLYFAINARAHRTPHTYITSAMFLLVDYIITYKYTVAGIYSLQSSHSTSREM